jgi:hypothetical protein
MNWDGSRPYEDFLMEWAQSTRDRDFVPSGGESPHQPEIACGHFWPHCRPDTHRSAWSPMAGVTTDLLRNLLTDQALPAGLLGAGIPPCAITTIDDLTVMTIAAVEHLA